ncbi:HERV-H LTR-associating protein 2 isoform X1 [Monodelphis domestica]|uniref:HERV-H LTR-associating protein 2 isoform X1 n=2 Tax=Monodelphis domestica TaxID=13616 RepID=UPI0024E24820|nr:HERV-H LTR-associating protein 2 isoform X1 [Monodelphis domestica]XP_007493688.2 HERV-H LTR-associating protein 2 isoform X1 [Monodelphis domestica]XP_056649416.1 HERV-H LTR-associating protein 2 isoform X1 [Monodelphis domestica]XP_056649417.1 HERV-H LTR-associating protein 2 isoform X1 [Monodelphis domestica]XP_056649418.1 HERV-H LTR-associating protein 2 isoform X1 [Monodelphis domestica]XP_056649419.1 HERV-H LTR-associating protein 2 isoform X1 [Monodelphis domestica]XP_056649420.1 HE
MKSQLLLYFLILAALSDGMTFHHFYKSILPLTTVTGRLGENVILPCKGKKGPNVLIHWKKKERNIHSYYNEKDHLELQDPTYTNRTFLFLNEINDGNASLTLKSLNLGDEGVYTCYVATDDISQQVEVKLQLGAFTRAVMEYGKQNGDTYLICYLFGAYPFPNIMWTENNATKQESKIEEISSQPPISVKSQLNVTDSNSSYQCIIENLVLNQRWIGTWKADTSLKTHGEEISFPCKLKNEDILPEKNIYVIWSRVENTSSTILASFSNNSGRMVNDNRFSWTTSERNDFSLTLKSPTPTDNGEYLCNISSLDYTQLTVTQFLGPESYQERSSILIILITFMVIAPIVIIVIIIVKNPKKCRQNGPDTDDARSKRAPVTSREMETRESEKMLTSS